MQMTIAVMEKGKTMSDYITKEEVLKLLTPSDTRISKTYIALVREEIKLRPSADVVKVVRCKDCKYLKPFTSQYGAGQYCECPCSFGGQGIKKPDDYCSYGERRDDREYNNSILNARKGEE